MITIPDNPLLSHIWYPRGLGTSCLEIHFLTVLEADGPRSRCWQFWLLLRLVGDHLLTLPSHCLMSMSVYVLISNPYKDTSHTELGPSHRTLFYTNLSLLGGSDGKESAAVRETQVWSLDREDLLKKEMATHSSILAWDIPQTEKPWGGYSPRGHKESDTT